LYYLLRIASLRGDILIWHMGKTENLKPAIKEQTKRGSKLIIDYKYLFFIDDKGEIL